jgi:hypothetical protein
VTATAFDAINRLRAALTSHGSRERVHILEPGESILVPPVSPVA